MLYNHGYFAVFNQMVADSCSSTTVPDGNHQSGVNLPLFPAPMTPYDCPYCSESFASLRDLSTHLDGHRFDWLHYQAVQSLQLAQDRANWFASHKAQEQNFLMNYTQILMKGAANMQAKEGEQVGNSDETLSDPRVEEAWKQDEQDENPHSVNLELTLGSHETIDLTLRL